MASPRPSHRVRHPVLQAHAEARHDNLQHRIADAITRFAGSMNFVWVHVVWFGVWIASSVESFPYGLLTMIVSLEAIFLSTFLLISQNRADERRAMMANAEWQLVQDGDAQNKLEVKQNEELLALSRQILDLTREIHVLQGQLTRHIAATQGLEISPRRATE